MSQVTDAFREHHQALSQQLSRYVTGISQGQTDADPQAFAAFLQNELLPHAAGEEAQLYPVMDELVRAHGTPTATMSVDHEYIENYVKAIQATARDLAGAAPAAQAPLHAKLAELGLQLKAIFAMHLAKEEQVYLPLFERYLPEDAQKTVLDALHQSAEASTAPELDVRTISPARRHALLFETFDSLEPGRAFILVNDHDPKPLYYQFAAEHEGEFTWDYADRGPEVWRVRVGKQNST